MARRVTGGTAADGPARVEAEVFGPTVVRIDGQVVDLGRRQVRLLVLALAAQPDWVSADVLVDHLWPDELPAHPRQALNVTMSRLRSALGAHADRLESAGNTYRLRFDSIDVQRFADAVENARKLEGRPAADAYGAALSLWTARPFSDDVGSPYIEGRRANLEELRWFAAIRRAELLLEVGEPDLALVASAHLVEADDVRERAVIAHATALAMMGRKSEALHETGEAIRRLREGLGLEPSEALLAIEREILTGSVELDAPAAKRNRPETVVFVGRKRELEALDRVATGRSLSVIAEAGTGKSSLLDRFAERSSDRGVDVIRVDVAATPERPLDAIARLCLLTLDRGGASAQAPIGPDFASALSRICPELGLEASVSLTREALVDDVTRFIELRCRGAVIVIDDAHWLDSGSADVVSQLIRRGRAAVIAGLRPSDNGRLGFLYGAQRGQVEYGDDVPDGRCETLMLRPFDRIDVAAMLASRSNRPADEALVDRMLEQSGGNALFLRLLVDRWVEGRDSDTELPSSILVTVGERLDLLARTVVDTLQIAAAIGTTFPLQVVRQLRPNADAELDAAVAAGIVRIDEASDTAAFAHAVVADACRQLVGAGRRVAIHEDVAAMLEFDGASAAEIARHHVAAASLDPARAIWTSLRAAGEFIGGLDWETALMHLDRATELADEFGIDDPWVRAQIGVRRGTVERALSRAGYLEDLLNGCEFAREAGDHELFVVAVTELCGHGRTTRAADIDQRVIPLLDEALQLDIDDALRAELCASAVPLFSTSNEADRGRHLFHEAWDLAARLGDLQVEAAVISHAHLGFAHPDDFDLLSDAARRMTVIAGSDAEMIWEAAFIRFECAVVTGDAAGARQAIDEMRLYTHEVTRRPRDFGLAFSESAHARLCGDLDAAERHAAAALEIGLERFDTSWATTIYGLLLLGIRRQQGRVAELADAAEAMIAAHPDYPPFHAVASLISVDRGDLVAARSHLDVVSADGFGRVVRDVHFTSVINLAAPATAAVGTEGEIAALDALLAKFSGRMSWNGASSDGAIDRGRALLAAARGDDLAACDLLRAADELEGRFLGPLRPTTPLLRRRPSTLHGVDPRLRPSSSRLDLVDSLLPLGVCLGVGSTTCRT